MAMKAIGKVQKYGNTIFVPIHKSVKDDTSYAAVAIDKGDRVEVSIAGDVLKVRKVI